MRGTEDNNNDVWVHEVGRALKGRLTFDAALDGAPIWSPSGKEITFRSARQGNSDIYIRPADGTGEPALLVATPLGERTWRETQRLVPDGKYLLYRAGLDLW